MGRGPQGTASSLAAARGAAAQQGESPLLTPAAQSEQSGCGTKPPPTLTLDTPSTTTASPANSTTPPHAKLHTEQAALKTGSPAKQPDPRERERGRRGGRRRVKRGRGPLPDSPGTSQVYHSHRSAEQLTTHLRGRSPTPERTQPPLNQPTPGQAAALPPPTQHQQSRADTDAPRMNTQRQHLPPPARRTPAGRRTQPRQHIPSRPQPPTPKSSLETPPTPGNHSTPMHAATSTEKYIEPEPNDAPT